MWQELPGPGGGSRELSEGRLGPVGSLGVHGGGLGPKVHHQEEPGQITVLRRAYLNSHPVDSLPPVLPLPMFCSPFTRVLFQNYSSNVVTLLIKPLDDSSAHKQKTKTIRLIFKAIHKLTSASLNLVLHSAPHLPSPTGQASYCQTHLQFSCLY